MTTHRILSTTVLFGLLCVTRPLYAQGPPCQTDDPVPVDYQHYEFYIFGGVDGTPREIDSTGPAIEFNWGAIPRVQLHAILASGSVHPYDKPLYAPGGAELGAFGLIDSELGIKVAFLKESPHFPQIGTFPMVEIPAGDAGQGLGVGMGRSDAPASPFIATSS